MTEAQLTHRVIEYLRKLKRDGEPVWWLKIHGGPLQHAGVPDLLIVYHGVVLFVELKAPGKKPTRLQLETMRRISVAGGWTKVIDTEENLIRLLDLIKDRVLKSPAVQLADQRESFGGMG